MILKVRHRTETVKYIKLTRQQIVQMVQTCRFLPVDNSVPDDAGVFIEVPSDCTGGRLDLGPDFDEVLITWTENSASSAE